MLQDDPKTLVSTDWLEAHLRDPDLRVLDGSWFLPQMNRDAKAAYDAAHIPGARFFDIDEISDSRSYLPHMAPPVEKFISRMRAMLSRVRFGECLFIFSMTIILYVVRFSLSGCGVLRLSPPCG